MFGAGPRPGGNAGGGGGGAMQAQMRQRMAERMQQDFAPFRATLDDTQKQRWDAELRTLLGAKRAPIYTLVNGKPEMVQVRIGASDGTSTEVSGAVKEGDVVVVGERAKE
jgi:HlyD family secretion protein